MPKLIRKERNIFYTHYEVEITEEQLQLYQTDKDKFNEDFIFNDSLEFAQVSERYVTTTDTEYFIDGIEAEPQFVY